jgi:hypothetical protein
VERDELESTEFYAFVRPDEGGNQPTNDNVDLEVMHNDDAQ